MIVVFRGGSSSISSGKDGSSGSHTKRGRSVMVATPSGDGYTISPDGCFLTSQMAVGGIEPHLSLPLHCWARSTSFSLIKNFTPIFMAKATSIIIMAFEWLREPSINSPGFGISLYKCTCCLRPGARPSLKMYFTLRIRVTWATFGGKSSAVSSRCFMQTLVKLPCPD